MIVIASLFFAFALALSVAVIVATIRNAAPRIAAIMEEEFAPAVRTERKIFVGEVKMRQRSPAQIIAFPARTTVQHKLAA